MSVNWKSLTLTPALLAAGMGIAMAGAEISGGERAAQQVERMAEALDLDAAQRANVEALFERNRPARRALMQRHAAHRQALRALQPGSADYTSRAQALADEAGSLARDRVLHRTQFQAELATVLTPEQMAKWGEHKARAHHGRWKGRDHAPAPGSKS